MTTTAPPLSSTNITMFLFFLKDMIASHSVLDKFDLQGSGLACMSLRSRCFKIDIVQVLYRTRCTVRWFKEAMFIIIVTITIFVFLFRTLCGCFVLMEKFFEAHSSAKLFISANTSVLFIFLGVGMDFKPLLRTFVSSVDSRSLCLKKTINIYAK